jgi:DNA polymerase-3 subunit alpha
VDVDLDTIPLDDEKTFKLFQAGSTVSVFQYESEGMQKVLRDLKPDKFEELIAVNALYRPGPMDYIPLFVDRKHGREKIEYDFDAIEDIMSETYGITVYQEQVMLAAQKLAGFSKGDADGLRKAMGKKKIKELEKLADKFFEGCEKNGHNLMTAKKVWNDWKAFASYAFNKSHATCYAWLGFQTAYLKVHYPSEYMAAVLNNAGNIDTIAFFMEECKRMGITVLGPDLNESFSNFSVNDKGEVRFGLGSIKGAGEKAVEFIIQEREENGPYQDIFDLCGRVNLRSVNKRVLESLAKGGAFDFDQNHTRAQYFKTEGNEVQTGIDIAIKHGIAQQANAANNQASLFGEDMGASLKAPSLPEIEPMSTLEKLRYEREVVGMFISGHPLDIYDFECKKIANAECRDLADLAPLIGETVRIAGMITLCDERISREGRPYGKYIIEDFISSYNFSLYKDDFEKFSPLVKYESHVLMTLEVYSFKDRKTNQDIVRTKIRKVEPLEDSLRNYVKGLTAKIDWNDLETDVVDEMVALLDKHKGATHFNFFLYDQQDGGEVTLGNPDLKVKPSSELMDKMEALGCKMSLELHT